MKLTWGLKRPGDIISRPLPAQIANSPVPFDIDGTEHAEPREIPPRSMTSSSLSNSQKQIKYGKGKYAHVELVPQPSDDPDDPLVRRYPRIVAQNHVLTTLALKNWPRWRKDLNLASLLVMVGLIGGMKTVFVSTAGALTLHYRASFTAIAALTAAPLMLSAMTSFLASIIAKFCGKRPVYLASALLLFIGTIWNMTAGDSYRSCLGARIFQGLGWGAFETLVMGSIQDTYYVRLIQMVLSFHYNGN